ncbi:glycoside hydrolase [Roridomyces roridus]|uniref:Glucanase n=1 Tax=Roridomyces roridus TaxID=1738132 RepID=A0AAD7BB37_9AGAR|nr:glycoside hydrolase [Roridomyces roridus]
MLSILLLASVAAAQQIGTFTPEVHPQITYKTCQKYAGCETRRGSITLDANYRWLHTASGQTCNPGGFNRTLCPDAETCGETCALDGADYAGTYGVTTNGSALSLLFGSGGARVYLLDDTGENYVNFQVMNQEFTFDIDVSNVPCAYNGALYFSEMPVNGGASPTNAAGAAYGTGYCDSQCPTGINFVNGTTNVDGSLGSCCNEMDLWEANSLDTQLTPHPCNVSGEFICTGSGCSNLCDPSGCEFNPFRVSSQTFYGPGSDNVVDTTKVMTVVTQFITDDGTSSGTLSEIKRFYVQDNKIIPNSVVTLPGLPEVNSITSDYCTAKMDVLDDSTAFNVHGGLAQMGASLARGAVLVVSLWDDLGGGMTWLDGQQGTVGQPGTLRGPCTAADVVSDSSTSVTFSNIRVGDLNSTFTAVHYAQCGGSPWDGPTICAEGLSCTALNEFYSQCL